MPKINEVCIHTKLTKKTNNDWDIFIEIEQGSGILSEEDMDRLIEHIEDVIDDFLPIDDFYYEGYKHA